MTPRQALDSEYSERLEIIQRKCDHVIETISERKELRYSGKCTKCGTVLHFILTIRFDDHSKEYIELNVYRESNIWPLFRACWKTRAKFPTHRSTIAELEAVFGNRAVSTYGEQRWNQL